ncbi:MAG: M15 family metallopeptidase [Myxococcota bacterium]
MVFLVVLLLGTGDVEADAFVGNASVIPPNVLEKMRGISIHEGCPVGPDDLRYLEISHWTLENHVERGFLVVHRDVADEVLAAFRAMYELGFPIERMRLVSEYGGSDERSMEANNTSAFNCRSVTGRPGVYSKHSYGKAIDINPRINPYVRGKRFAPKNARKFLDRSRNFPGSINAGSPVIATFAKLGWSWGGKWRSLKDYQHFEKRR